MILGTKLIKFVSWQMYSFYFAYEKNILKDEYAVSRLV